MLDRAKTVDRDLHARLCVSCGGPCDRARMTPSCPQCGCDFRRRPPRSYAEMEGLVEVPPGPSAASIRALAIQRWLAFLFCVMLGLLVSLFLLGAALP